MISNTLRIRIKTLSMLDKLLTPGNRYGVSSEEPFAGRTDFFFSVDAADGDDLKIFQRLYLTHDGTPYYRTYTRATNIFTSWKSYIFDAVNTSGEAANSAHEFMLAAQQYMLDAKAYSEHPVLSSDGSITDMKALIRDEFTAIPVPHPTTLYIIKKTPI